MQTALWLLKKVEMLDEPHQPTKALIWFNLNWGWGGGGLEGRGWEHASFLTGIELSIKTSP